MIGYGIFSAIFMLDFLKGKSILVTGGTGSFGQKFIDVLLQNSEAGRIIIFSRDELKQSQMAEKFKAHSERLRFFLGDVRDLPRLERAFAGVDYVVHAAALKQVPALEYNPFEAVNTNILGTKNVIDAAIDCGVEKVVLVSTDKAANPANLYGATKLCAERLIVSGNNYTGGKTLLSVVRYGNVIGSRGSLVHLINEQKKNGEINLTHPEMTRFWITLDQGVDLVLMALEKMHGGEIFIPKIPAMRIEDFLKILAPECTVKIVGIRPGEKLHETLVTPEEARHTIDIGSHYVIMPEHQWPARSTDFAGQVAPEGFVYSSNMNADALQTEELQAMLQSIM